MMRTILLLTAVVFSSITDLGSTPRPDDPPPFDCPLCGGNPALHRQILSSFARAQGEYMFAYLDRRM